MFFLVNDLASSSVFNVLSVTMAGVLSTLEFCDVESKMVFLIPATSTVSTEFGKTDATKSRFFATACALCDESKGK